MHYQGCLWVINILTHKTPVCGILNNIKISNHFQGCLWVINILTHKTPVCGMKYNDK